MSLTVCSVGRRLVGTSCYQEGKRCSERESRIRAPVGPTSSMETTYEPKISIDRVSEIEFFGNFSNSSSSSVMTRVLFRNARAT